MAVGLDAVAAADLVDAAVADGRLSAARAEHWRRMLVADSRMAEALAALTPIPLPDPLTAAMGWHGNGQ